MIEQLDQDRRRQLLARVRKQEQGWQSVWVTSEFDQPCVSKGRYIAAKEFAEWLQAGGDLKNAQQYLDDRTAYWAKEEATFDSYLLAHQLAERIEKGLDTKESLKGFEAHIWGTGALTTPAEKRQMEFLKMQYMASRVELWHLARLLK